MAGDGDRRVGAAEGGDRLVGVAEGGNRALWQRGRGVTQQVG